MGTQPHGLGRCLPPVGPGEGENGAGLVHDAPQLDRQRSRQLAAGLVVASALSWCGGGAPTHPARAGAGIRTIVTASGDLLPVPQPDLGTVSRVIRQRQAPDKAVRPRASMDGHSSAVS